MLTCIMKGFPRTVSTPSEQGSDVLRTCRAWSEGGCQGGCPAESQGQSPADLQPREAGRQAEARGQQAASSQGLGAEYTGEQPGLISTCGRRFIVSLEGGGGPGLGEDYRWPVTKVEKERRVRFTAL